MHVSTMKLSTLLLLLAESLNDAHFIMMVPDKLEILKDGQELKIKYEGHTIFNSTLGNMVYSTQFRRIDPRIEVHFVNDAEEQEESY